MTNDLHLKCEKCEDLTNPEKPRSYVSQLTSVQNVLIYVPKNAKCLSNNKISCEILINRNFSLKIYDNLAKYSFKLNCFIFYSDN